MFKYRSRVDEVTLTTLDLWCFLWILDHGTTLHAIISQDSVRWHLIDRLAFATLDLRWALDELEILSAVVADGATLWQTGYSFPNENVSER